MGTEKFLTQKRKLKKLNHALYCITSEEYSCGRRTLDVARQIITSGVKILQYREKEKTKKEKFKEARKIILLARKAGATFIVNDDIDLALALKADGVHLGQQDLPITEARKLVGNEMIIGVSTHSPKQAQEAVRAGADYIGVGPLYPTTTKKDVCPAVGLEYLDYVVKNINIPFVAIGGIKLHNLKEVLNHGARCVAMVTEIISAPNIPLRIRLAFKELSL
ncbi:MAG: thiamine phosphate synthase [Candidatus Omnitrophica bacterium]|nr:thiamine phosphate synthase [Candidatus Omnitrophota bacterium]